MHWRSILATTAWLAWAGAAPAIDRIVLEVGELSIGGAQVSGLTVELDLAQPSPTAAVKAEQLTMKQAATSFSKLSVVCSDLSLKEPLFACDRARVLAQGGPTQVIDMRVAARYDSAKHTLRLAGSELAVAGGQVRFAANLVPDGWSAEGHATAMQIPQLRKLATPWVSLPADFNVDGRLIADVSASGGSAPMRGQIVARTGDLNFSNGAGTVVGEKLQARITASVQKIRQSFTFATNIESGAGQMLAGAVLLDFGANPLQLAAQGGMQGKILELQNIAIAQKNLLNARAQARVQIGGKPAITQARAQLTKLQFPAAYTSFLQIGLAATGFGALETSGSARGAIEIAADEIKQLNVQIDDLDLKDDKTQFAMLDLRGDMHWSPRADARIEPSHLTWSKARAYGLSGGTAELNFIASGMGFELTREARLPIFDGAVVVHSLAARNLGGAQAELDFDAHIEPISMALLSKAFGWPELSGQLAGRIPGLTYRNNLLTLNGDLTANVFDGTITGSRFRLRDPLGPWPRLFADVTARRLDLELVTSTFSIGSITGRLDAELKGLELFNWSPVAFDARLYSTPKDRSPRRISQKAVTSISSIGGGSGGVTQALQSGVLRFFDEFRYDRIGINCQLRNEVCLMTGVEPHGAGYYIVKGWGIPRIDIIGNAGRVDWPQLVTQIVAGMASENVIVR